jgi:hypothetical protein
VKASDGRIVLAKNEPLPGGGWVSTHEDVTEQRTQKRSVPPSALKNSGARTSTRLSHRFDRPSKNSYPR